MQWILLLLALIGPPALCFLSFLYVIDLGLGKLSKSTASVINDCCFIAAFSLSALLEVMIASHYDSLAVWAVAVIFITFVSVPFIYVIIDDRLDMRQNKRLYQQRTQAMASSE